MSAFRDTDVTQNFGGLEGTELSLEVWTHFPVLRARGAETRAWSLNESATARGWVGGTGLTDHMGRSVPFTLSLVLPPPAPLLINSLLSPGPAPGICSLAWGLLVFAFPVSACLAATQTLSVGFLPGAMGRWR